MSNLEIQAEADRRHPPDHEVPDPHGATGVARSDEYGYEEAANRAFVAGAVWALATLAEPMLRDIVRAEERLVVISQWIDKGNAHRDPEARTWGRLAKIAEEGGEVIAEYIGVTGQNPRKGVNSDIHKVAEELLDVAVTALGAYEHLYDHPGLALQAVANKINTVHKRMEETVLAELEGGDPGFGPEDKDIEMLALGVNQHNECDSCGAQAGTTHRPGCIAERVAEADAEEEFRQ
jgi:hypothetical protein